MKTATLSTVIILLAAIAQPLSAQGFEMFNNPGFNSSFNQFNQIKEMYDQRMQQIQAMSGQAMPNNAFQQFQAIHAQVEPPVEQSLTQLQGNDASYRMALIQKASEILQQYPPRIAQTYLHHLVQVANWADRITMQNPGLTDEQLLAAAEEAVVNSWAGAAAVARTHEHVIRAGTNFIRHQMGDYSPSHYGALPGQ